jgi:hypothetical protein
MRFTYTMVQITSEASPRLSTIECEANYVAALNHVRKVASAPNGLA